VRLFLTRQRCSKAFSVAFDNVRNDLWAASAKAGGEIGGQRQSNRKEAIATLKAIRQTMAKSTAQLQDAAATLRIVGSISWNHVQFVSLNLSLRMDWPASLIKLRQWVGGLVSVSVPSLVPSECVVNDEFDEEAHASESHSVQEVQKARLYHEYATPTSVYLQYFGTQGPFVLAIVVSGCVYIVARCKKNQSLMNQVLHFFIAFYTIALMGMVYGAIEMLDCTEDSSGLMVLETNPKIQCTFSLMYAPGYDSQGAPCAQCVCKPDDHEHGQCPANEELPFMVGNSPFMLFAPVSGTMLVIILVIVPVASLRSLRRASRHSLLDDDGYHSRMGWLYNRYERRCYYFEGFTTVTKIALVVPSVLMSSDEWAAVVACWCVFVELLALLAQVYFKPYKRAISEPPISNQPGWNLKWSKHNQLAVIGFAGQLLVAMSGLLSKFGAPDDTVGQRQNDAIDILVVVLVLMGWMGPLCVAINRVAKSRGWCQCGRGTVVLQA
jgi:hypothetical protein